MTLGTAVILLARLWKESITTVVPDDNHSCREVPLFKTVRLSAQLLMH